MRVVVLMKNMGIAILRAQGGCKANDCSICSQKGG